MEFINEVKLIHSEHLELLETLGYTRIDQLEHISPDELTQELQKANDALEICPSAPDSATVEAWLRHIFLGDGEAESAETVVVESSSGAQKHVRLMDYSSLPAELAIAPQAELVLPEDLCHVPTDEIPVAQPPTEDSPVYICKKTGLPTTKEKLSLDLSKVKRKEGEFYRAQQAMGAGKDSEKVEDAF